MRILIVDDEVGMRETMAQAVRMFDDRYEVSEAEDGEEALRILDDTFDLVITDIRMPGMDGVELVRRIRRRGSTVTIFMLTGYAEFEYARAAIQTNVTEYMLKPVSVHTLREAIAGVSANIAKQREHEKIARLREQTLLEKRVQDLLYELPLPYYDEWMFPDYDTIVVLSFVIADVAAGGRMSRFAVKNVLGDVLREHGVPLVFVEESHLTCVLFANDGHPPSEELAARCSEAVRLTLRRELRIGIGGTGTKLSEIGALYWASLGQLGIEPAGSQSDGGIDRGGSGLPGEQPSTAASSGESDSSGLNQEGLHHLVRQTIHILETEYGGDITLSGLAERLYLNPNYLSTLFKNETGTTFTQALMRIRMEKAKALLRTTKLKIYEVGCRVGYADSAHFSRVFKNHERMSPYEYRDRHAQT